MLSLTNESLKQKFWIFFNRIKKKYLYTKKKYVNTFSLQNHFFLYRQNIYIIEIYPSQEVICYFVNWIRTYIGYDLTNHSLNVYFLCIKERHQRNAIFFYLYSCWFVFYPYLRIWMNFLFNSNKIRHTFSRQTRLIHFYLCL